MPSIVEQPDNLLVAGSACRDAWNVGGVDGAGACTTVLGLDRTSAKSDSRVILNPVR